MKKYVVRLSSQERQRLSNLIASGTGPARLFARARILLKADVGAHGPAWSDARISEALDVTVQTVERVREQLVEEGFEAVLKRHPYRQKVSRRKVDGELEAHLVALACSQAPRGRSRWSLRLLADRMVELGYIESISHETVRRTLKKRVEALAVSALVHPTRGQCRLCLRHGRRARALQAPVGPAPAAGVHG